MEQNMQAIQDKPSFQFGAIVWDKSLMAHDREVFIAKTENLMHGHTVGIGAFPFSFHAVDGPDEQKVAAQWLTSASEKLAASGLQSNATGKQFWSRMGEMKTKSGEIALGFNTPAANTYFIGKIADLPQGVLDILDSVTALHKNI
uniref:Uncharacterized protein n=1 Tax=uncultured bacterium W5-102b TaxID=1130996 RepID=H9BWI8_9BACT|nr:hypothetical protein [uncultured bacterium W5-102b]